MKKSDRKRLGCLTWIMWALLVIIAALAVAIIFQQNMPREDRAVHQIRTERLSPDVTSVPAPTAWVRYPVPLEDELQRYIGQVCQDYGVPAELVLAVIDSESDFQAGEIGDSGASYGLMQVMASEHTERCVRLNCYNLLDPRQNIRAGVDFLAALFATYGNWEQALSFYHGESGELPSVYADTVLARAEVLAESAVVEIY